MASRARMRVAALLGALAVLLWLAAPALASGRAARPAPLRGVNLEGISPQTTIAEIDHEVAVAHEIHADVVRERMPWSLLMPSGPGQIDAHVAALARALTSAAAADHIKVIALLDGTPCWAASAPASLLAECAPGASNEAEAWPPVHAAYFGEFAGWLAKRYGSKLAAIEVWNEPDQINEHYLAGSEKPRHYADLLKAAYPAIKRVDKRLPVLAGSLVGPNGAFLKALYEQGIKGHYDGLSVHFYSLVLGSIRSFREVELENGDDTPLWLDEFGWSSCWPKYKIEQEQGCVTQAVQAENIRNVFKELSRAHYVKAMLTYGFRDSKGEEFGFLNPSGTHKPTFAALAQSFASPFGAPRPITVRLRRQDGHVLASGVAPVGDYMKLEALRDGRLRYDAVFTLNRFNRYRLTLPVALGTHGLTVRVWQYWLGDSRSAQSSI